MQLLIFQVDVQNYFHPVQDVREVLPCLYMYTNDITKLDGIM